MTRADTPVTPAYLSNVTPAYDFIIYHWGSLYYGEDNQGHPIFRPTNDIGLILNRVAVLNPSGGGLVYIESGSYTCSTQVTFSAPIRIVGASSGDADIPGTTIVDNVSSNPWFFADGTNAAFKNIWFENIRFEISDSVDARNKDMFRCYKMQAPWGFKKCFFDNVDRACRRVLWVQSCYGLLLEDCAGDGFTDTAMIFHNDSGDNNNWGNQTVRNCHFYFPRNAVMCGGAGLQDNIAIENSAFPAGGGAAFSYARTTLNGAIAAGAAGATLTDATGFSAGDYIVMLGTNPECIKIATVNGNDITFDTGSGCLFAHGNAAAVYRGRIPVVFGSLCKASHVTGSHFENCEIGMIIADGANGIRDNIFGANTGHCIEIDGGRFLDIDANQFQTDAVGTTAITVQNNAQSEAIVISATNRFQQQATILTNSSSLVGLLRGAARGTGTINSGATSATITHTLPFTPVAAQIVITLTENPTNTPGAIWVDTIGATTFQVNCENDPGASNLDFSWAVI